MKRIGSRLNALRRGAGWLGLCGWSYFFADDLKKRTAGLAAYKGGYESAV